MRALSEEFKQHISSEVTTLCRCWILELNDGSRLGFTNHDEDILLENVLCERNAGMEASGIEEELGLNINSSEVSGAIQSELISEKAIESGELDNAKITTYRVNWQKPYQFHREGISHVGKITREDGFFRFEVRGLASVLDQTKGRHFVKRCQADLGDNQCGVNVDTAAYSANGSVGTVLEATSFSASGFSNFEAGWFRNGRLVWASVANAGQSIEILEHKRLQSEVVFSLWQPMPRKVAEGDAFKVYAGCSKDFETCKKKFANGLNFRGFPHMPGNTFALGYAGNLNTFDGEPIVR